MHSTDSCKRCAQAANLHAELLQLVNCHNPSGTCRKLHSSTTLTQKEKDEERMRAAHSRAIAASGQRAASG